MKDKIGIVGDFTWEQIRSIMITKLIEIETEEEFTEFVRRMSTSIGTLKEIQHNRKRLGLKPLSKEEIREAKLK